MYAYPAFRGTRDEKLVQIMRKRIDCFSLLLGGARASKPDEVLDTDELWRTKAIEAAKSALREIGQATLRTEIATAALTGTGPRYEQRQVGEHINSNLKKHLPQHLRL